MKPTLRLLPSFMAIPPLEPQIPVCINAQQGDHVLVNGLFTTTSVVPHGVPLHPLESRIAFANQRTVVIIDAENIGPLAPHTRRNALFPGEVFGDSTRMDACMLLN